MISRTSIRYRQLRFINHWQVVCVIVIVGFVAPLSLVLDRSIFTVERSVVDGYVIKHLDQVVEIARRKTSSNVGYAPIYIQVHGDSIEIINFSWRAKKFLVQFDVDVTLAIRNYIMALRVSSYEEVARLLGEGRSGKAIDDVVAGIEKLDELELKLARRGTALIH